MKPIWKYLAVHVFLAMSLAALTGCMIVTPAMVTPCKFKISHSDIQGQEQSVPGAVSEMALNRSTYKLLELGRIEADNRAFPEKMFREVIVNQIAASLHMVLTEPGQGQAAASGLTGEDQQVRAILDPELLRLVNPKTYSNSNLKMHGIVESCGKNGFTPCNLLHLRRLSINKDTRVRSGGF